MHTSPPGATRPRHRATPPATPKQGDDGSIAIFVAVVVTALLIVVGLLIDGAGKLRAVEQADALAEEAARAGGQEINAAQAITGAGVVVDPYAAQAAAERYLVTTGVSGRVRISDGGRGLDVTVTRTFATTFWSLIGIDTMTVTGHGHATLLNP